MDQLPSVLEDAKLQSISQEYNPPINSFELIRCHGDLQVDHFFDKTDLIMMYEEQLKVELWFSLDEFYKNILNFHRVSVAQVHSNS